MNGFSNIKMISIATGHTKPNPIAMREPEMCMSEVFTKMNEGTYEKPIEQPANKSIEKPQQEHQIVQAEEPDEYSDGGMGMNLFGDSDY